MASADRPPQAPDPARPAREPDWEAMEEWPEFLELTSRRRAFVLPATIFFLAYYMAFVLLCGYAPDFMGEKITGGLTVGYLLALTQFVMVAGLGLWYLRKAEHEFDPLSQKVIDRAETEAAK